MNNVIRQIKDALLLFPEQTQLAISVIKHQKVIHYGFVKNSDGTSVINNAEAAFEIGSITKVFTATLLALMIESGKLCLDDPIEKFLPFTIKGKPAITLKHLVSHTSGLPRLPSDFFSHPDYLASNPYLNYNEQRLITYLSEYIELESSPGEQFSYSNLGYGLLSYLLTIFNDQLFEKLIEKYILLPLKMHHSGFNRKSIKTSIVKGMDSQGAIASSWDGGVLSGCVGMLSTSSDLSKFALQMLKPKKVDNLQLQVLAEIRPGASMCMGWARSSALQEPEIFGMEAVPLVLAR